MRALRLVVLDFETQAIEDRPRYPPKPVGFSLFLPGERKPTYCAFGHPSQNNCTEQIARDILAKAYARVKSEECGLLCHHAKFDLDVAETHWGLAIPPWQMIHDTLFLLFLDDPHSPDLQLKPSAERLLGLPPEESDALRDFAIAQKWIPRSAKEYGHLIARMPGALVGKYANGDTFRTLKLFQLLHPRVVHERGMGEPYDRERQLLPSLLRSEREGIRINVPLLTKDVALYDRALGTPERPGLVDQWLRRRLKCKDLHVDSDEALADALVASGAADENLFLTTPTGARSVSKKSLPLAVTDYKVLHALQYRSMLQTRLGTFLRPWLLEAQATGGRVHARWNQVRQYGAGAKTGRISASRFMNAPVGVGTSQHDDSLMLAYRHPDFIKDLPQLPQVRIYLLPDKGCVWAKRDFAQQELRILAHLEDGVLLRAYQDNPKLDVHQFAVELFKKNYGVEVSRTRTKTIGFSLLYGMGVGELAQRLQLDIATTKQLKAGYMEIFAGLDLLQKDLKRRAAEKLPIRTFGGREYFCEPPRFLKKRGRVVSFEYKLLNYVVQGGAADVTKQALINYFETQRDGKFLITVHDEINLSVPKAALRSEMKLLKDAMADIQTDCAMLSDGEVGPNWAQLKDYRDEA